VNVPPQAGEFVAQLTVVVTETVALAENDAMPGSGSPGWENSIVQSCPLAGALHPTLTGVR
jgi:hypothetical protein